MATEDWHTHAQQQLIFIHNTPSDLESFIDCFSHVKIVFFRKSIASKLQPLYAGIIKDLKVFYRKRLLQYLLAKIKLGSQGIPCDKQCRPFKVYWMGHSKKLIKKRLSIVLSVVSTKLNLSIHGWWSWS